MTPTDHLSRKPVDELQRLLMETRALLRHPQALPANLAAPLAQYERDLDAAIKQRDCIDARDERDEN